LKWEKKRERQIRLRKGAGKKKDPPSLGRVEGLADGVYFTPKKKRGPPGCERRRKEGGSFLVLEEKYQRWRSSDEGDQSASAAKGEAKPARIGSARKKKRSSPTSASKKKNLG